MYSWQTWLYDFPSAPGVNATSATSAPPSRIISQGQWHAPVEPSPQLPWRLFSHWAGYLSLSQWWCDKCYNYVNSVQPKCFCKLNIASWKALGGCFQLLSYVANNPSCVTAHLRFCPLFIFSLFHTLFLNRGERKTTHLIRQMDRCSIRYSKMNTFIYLMYWRYICNI